MGLLEEVWKPTRLDSRYDVSNLGRVRRGDRILHRRNHRSGYQLTTITAKHPSVYIHRLVAEAFIGPCPSGYEVNHLDFDRANNRADNLQYVTRKGNVRYTIAHGRAKFPPNECKAKGERCHSAVLTEGDVSEIRRLASVGGIYKTEIARRFGIHVRQVFKIINREQWRHVA